MENFDFNRIGKRTPYRVPDNFFSDAEDRIIQSIRRPMRQKSSRMRKIICLSVSMAASISLLLVATKSGIFRSQEDFSEISTAFDNLSDEDQAYLIDTFQEDIFINDFNQ